ncbi:MAG: polyprenyl synthetase family protein [Alphaproteobacteria bacterium]|nr:polyprenyl synthetase family protein [Alphaproteobacteria bacterium SS10]
MPPATNPQRAPDVAEGGLERLHAAFTDDLALVNKLIIERMQSPVALIPQLAGYIVAAGGKRLRPLLTLASAKLCGYQGDRHYGLATCVEFIHTATLLHDDVVDESLARRGQASANAEFGNQASVLVGDFLFTRAFQLMIGDGSLEVLDVLCQASATIAEGEVMQLITTNDLETDEARYLEVIEGKTAVLFAAACQVGAMVAERPANEVEALRLFGEKLGMAFQLIDDILDYSADRRSWGKQIGDDFKEGKMTLPVVLSLAAADQEQNVDERAFWERTIGRQEQDESDLDKALELMSRHNSLELARDRAKQYAEAAVEALAPFDATDPTYQLLVDAVMASVQRQR